MLKQPYICSMNWRKFLAPFAGIYWIITFLRNLLYQIGVFPSKRFNKAIIVVGNLTTGGTGKSPHTIYLLSILRNKFKTAVLSRGYKRDTSGFIIANYDSTAKQIGDEPMQFFNRFKNRVIVAVGEDRVAAIKQLLQRFSLDSIVLDDAFQHRKLKADFYILLTEYGNLYSDDYVLPVGNLRESSFGARRANLVIVTKCKDFPNLDEAEAIKKQLKIRENQNLFFSKVVYSNVLEHKQYPMHFNEATKSNVLLISGIVKSKDFYLFIKDNFLSVKHFKYPDHYNYKPDDIKQITKAYEEMSEPKIMLTTEKDYMRLKHEYALMENLYYLPISIQINREEEFNKIIENHVQSHKRSR